MLDVLLGALARLDAMGVTPWNIWVEPPRTVKVTLSERPSSDLAHRIVAALEPLKVDAHWHEVSVDVQESEWDLDDGDLDADDLGTQPPDACGVCGGPGPLRECRLDPSAQPKGGWAIASTWHVCSACLTTIAAADPDALKSRLQPEDRAAPYADVLVGGLLDGIRVAP